MEKQDLINAVQACKDLCELLSAAQKLKAFCKKTKCETCPFYIEEIDYCGIRVPEEWILDDTEKSEDEKWKALLD